ncbi:MAG TPA: universal stress protein [Terriglobia bacterium]|nr:universal stress protein [Terriglobia bacterium]
MLKIERILCPTDFSEFSEKATDYALSLARHYEATLVLQHIVEPLTWGYAGYAMPDSVYQLYGELREHSETQLRELVKARGADLHTQVVVHVGTPIDSILSLAERQAIDLIVMGTHGRRGLDRLTMGSVTERVLRKAHCPVLAVRKPAHDFVATGKDSDPVQLRKILLCTDFSDFAHRAADYAFSLAMEYNAEITLLHVLEEVPEAAQVAAATAEATRKLEELVPSDARNWCKAQSVVRTGKPYQEIVQLATEAQTDLIIMGVRGRNVLDLALFGSTTHRVLQLGSCPVLAVRI